MKQILGRSEGLEPESRLVQVRALTTSKAMESQVSGWATRALVELNSGISSPDQSPAPVSQCLHATCRSSYMPLRNFSGLSSSGK